MVLLHYCYHSHKRTYEIKIDRPGPNTPLILQLRVTVVWAWASEMRGSVWEQSPWKIFRGQTLSTFAQNTSLHLFQSSRRNGWCTLAHQKVLVIDEGAGGTLGHVPPRFCNKQRSALFIFRKCSFFVKERCY